MPALARLTPFRGQDLSLLLRKRSIEVDRVARSGQGIDKNAFFYKNKLNHWWNRWTEQNPLKLSLSGRHNNFRFSYDLSTQKSGNTLEAKNHNF